MNTTAVAIAILGIATSLITIISFLWKITNGVANLRTANAATQWKIESQEAVINQVRERVEHLTTRLDVRVEKNSELIEDIQGYLQKETSYERRSNR